MSPTSLEYQITLPSILPKQIGSRLWAFWPTYLPSVMSQAVAKNASLDLFGRKDEDILLLHPEQ